MPMSCSSVPLVRTSLAPEASQNASPKVTSGIEVTINSWISSTVLMKCACPIMIFTSSGFLIGTSFNSILVIGCLSSDLYSLLLSHIFLLITYCYLLSALSYFLATVYPLSIDVYQLFIYCLSAICYTLFRLFQNLNHFRQR